MKLTGIIAALLFCISSFAQTRTVKELYDEYYANKAAFAAKYRNQRMTVTGKVRSISVASEYWKDQDTHKIYLTATGYESFVVCVLPYKDSAALRGVKTGEFITVTGTAQGTITDAVYLTNCTLTAAKPVVADKKAPADAPLGKYEVYQDDGSGFNYKYRFTLQSYSSYELNGKAGNCTYDKRSKVIRFTTGDLKGFTGIYRPATDNEKDPPGFLLDVKGTVPVINGSHRGYQFAYYKG